MGDCYSTESHEYDRPGNQPDGSYNRGLQPGYDYDQPGRQPNNNYDAPGRQPGGNNYPNTDNNIFK